MSFTHAFFTFCLNSRQVSWQEVRQHLTRIMSFHNSFRFSKYVSKFSILSSIILFSLLSLFTYFLLYLVLRQTLHMHVFMCEGHRCSEGPRTKSNLASTHVTRGYLDASVEPRLHTCEPHYSKLILFNYLPSLVLIHFGLVVVLICRISSLRGKEM